MEIGWAIGNASYAIWKLAGARLLPTGAQR